MAASPGTASAVAATADDPEAAAGAACDAAAVAEAAAAAGALFWEQATMGKANKGKSAKRKDFFMMFPEQAKNEFKDKEEKRRLHQQEHDLAWADPPASVLASRIQPRNTDKASSHISQVTMPKLENA